MAKFRCVNKFCEKNINYIFEFAKVKWSFNNETKKLDHNLLCDFCNEKLELIPAEQKGDINIYFAKFRASSIEQRKEIIKKRAKEHNRTKMKDRVQEVRKKLLGL